MGRLDEIVSEQFARWEQRGRGWHVWPHSVIPEPPYRPFTGFSLPRPNVEWDDGQKPTLFSSFFKTIEEKFNPKPPVIPEPELEEDPEPEVFERDQLAELQTLLPANLDIRHEAFADFLQQLRACREPVSFELFGTSEQIAAQFAVHRDDVRIIRRQLNAYFPEVAFLETQNSLSEAWQHTEGENAIVEFGLEQEFLLPLATGRKLDPFVGLIGAMSELCSGEIALFQVLFQTTEHNWEKSAWNAITDEQGRSVFANRPDLIIKAKEKFASPLHAVVLRIGVKAPEFDRAWEIVRELAFALRIFASSEGNALIPLHNEEYPMEVHEEDVLLRQTHRSGMLLNTSELMGFVHFPSPIVRSPKLVRQVEHTKAAPASVTQDTFYVLGENHHLRRVASVCLSPDQRVRHMHVIGSPGTGKSTFIFNLICQDILNHQGLAVLDPHGDLIDKILGCIPENRVNDVILVDPSDEEYSLGFNILHAHSDQEKTLLASDLVAVFERLSTSWGDQMNSVLSNAILAFLKNRQNGTLADLRRFLIEPTYRNEFLKTVNDPEVIYYWQKGFPLLTGNKSVGPLLTRLGEFLALKPIRYMVSQKENKLDFADIMNSGKILLAKLSHGRMGKENSSLMGSLLMAKLHLAAIGRQNLPETHRRSFWCYVDECHNFITPSMTEILTGARKYRVGMILAHQDLSQLERNREIGSAVLGCNTQVVFRVNDGDARKLSEGFSFFEARDFQNLEKANAICRVERSDHDFNLAVPFPDFIPENEAAQRRQEVITASRIKYSTPRKDLEAKEAQFVEEQGLEKIPEPKPLKQSEVVPSTSSIVDAEIIKKIFSLPDEKAPTSSPQEDTGSKQDDSGRGGVEHVNLQKQIKAAAEALGFIARKEGDFLEHHMAVDVYLTREPYAFACEIGIKSTIKQELEHVRKCIKAGIPSIVLISVEPERVKKTEAAVLNTFGPETVKRVSCFLPDDFIKYLESLPIKPPPAPPGTKIKKGYTVKTNFVQLSSEETKQKEAEAIKLIAENMKKKKPKGQK